MTQAPLPPRYIIEVIDSTGAWLDYSRHTTQAEALAEFIALRAGFPNMRVIDSIEQEEIARQSATRINPINLIRPRRLPR